MSSVALMIASIERAMKMEEDAIAASIAASEMEVASPVADIDATSTTTTASSISSASEDGMGLNTIKSSIVNEIDDFDGAGIDVFEHNAATTATAGVATTAGKGKALIQALAMTANVDARASTDDFENTGETPTYDHGFYGEERQSGCSSMQGTVFVMVAAGVTPRSPQGGPRPKQWLEEVPEGPSLFSAQTSPEASHGLICRLIELLILAQRAVGVVSRVQTSSGSQGSCEREGVVFFPSHAYSGDTQEYRQIVFHRPRLRTRGASMRVK